MENHLWPGRTHLNLLEEHGNCAMEGDLLGFHLLVCLLQFCFLKKLLVIYFVTKQLSLCSKLGHLKATVLQSKEEIVLVEAECKLTNSYVRKCTLLHQRPISFVSFVPNSCLCCQHWVVLLLQRVTDQDFMFRTLSLFLIPSWEKLSLSHIIASKWWNTLILQEAH